MEIKHWLELKSPLLVGEGNFSFAASLARLRGASADPCCASVPDKSNSLSAEQIANMKLLRKLGGFAFAEVDAQAIRRRLATAVFGSLIFNFPNTGQRNGVWSTTAEHVLLRRFLRSAMECLTRSSPILITAVESTHYDGRFRYEDAAEWAGVRLVGAHPFDPVDFPGYRHVNTNDETSAIAERSTFKTVIFEANG